MEIGDWLFSTLTFVQHCNSVQNNQVSQVVTYNAEHKEEKVTSLWSNLNVSPKNVFRNFKSKLNGFPISNQP